MTISENGQKLTQSCEGLGLKAYKDVAGVLTIGYGHTGPDVHEGQEITEEQAANLLLDDLESAETCVNGLVTVELSQCQFDALVDFVYNLGCHAFKNSTLLRYVNMGSFVAASSQFLMWVSAGGKMQPGLVNRRKAEIAMWNGTWKP